MKLTYPEKPELRELNFPFQENEAYRLALKLNQKLFQIFMKRQDIFGFYQNYGDIVNQMQRCCSSIALNIAEAYGKEPSRDGERGSTIMHLGHAMGSLNEFVACIDIIQSFPMDEIDMTLLKELRWQLQKDLVDIKVQSGRLPSYAAAEEDTVF